MKMTVYLQSSIIDILNCFGNLSDVINKILDTCVENDILLTDMPTCIGRLGSTGYVVDIKNEEYLAMLELYPVNSSKISLRRIIYWFVENEKYNDFGWIMQQNYVNSSRERVVKKTDKILSDLNILIRLVNEEEKSVVQNAILELRKLQ